jgi:predicted SprT family Zn-dependent metalloprotease
VYHAYEVERNQRRQVVLYRCERCGIEFRRARHLPGKGRYVHQGCGGKVRYVGASAA